MHEAVRLGQVFLEHIMAADGRSLEEISLIDLDAAIYLKVGGVGFACRPLAT